VLCLLGPPAVRLGDVLRPLKLRPKAVALLVRVALEGPSSRAELADLIFGEAEDPRAALRWHLTYLRAQLPEPLRKHLLGRREEAKRLRKQIQAMPSRDPRDPNYRRLRYIRYADDWLLGFCGPRSEAEEIKARLAEFLREHLKLELSEAKTLITHGRTQAARFLGYEVMVHHNTTRRTKGQRSLNGSVGLRMPRDVVKSKAAPYMRYGKPMHRMERSHDSPFSIVEQHQAEYRGLVEYYRMAYNLHRLNYLKWIMETSMTKTLARKLRISVRKVYKRFRNTLQAPDGPHKVLQVKVERPERPPLVATWGNISLAHRKGASLTTNLGKSGTSARNWSNG
jgi:hypothetical protein